MLITMYMETKKLKKQTKVFTVVTLGLVVPVFKAVNNIFTSYLHSGCLDSKKFLSTIDPPPGVPGVSKNHIFFSTNENVFLLR